MPTYGADGFVPISTLGNEYFRYDEASHSLVGERSGHGYRLGDPVSVRLVNILPLAGSMQFEMLTEPRKLPKGSTSFHKSATRSRKTKRAAAMAGQRKTRRK